MTTENQTSHPLDRQNEIERAIQLEGSKDPENFKMPDGRTLSEVQKSNQELQKKEYQDELVMVSERTREQSIADLQKGKNLVVTSAGNIIDVTTPSVSEEDDSANTRTTMAEIESGTISSPQGAEQPIQPTAPLVVSKPAPTPSTPPSSNFGVNDGN